MSDKVMGAPGDESARKAGGTARAVDIIVEKGGRRHGEADAFLNGIAQRPSSCEQSARECDGDRARPWREPCHEGSHMAGEVACGGFADRAGDGI
jgi:hypothetical protein